MSTGPIGPPVQVMSIAEAAAILATELDNERLCVELFPARHPRFPGHMVRVATGANPLWYRRLALQVSPRHRRPADAPPESAGHTSMPPCAASPPAAPVVRGGNHSSCLWCYRPLSMRGPAHE